MINNIKNRQMPVFLSSTFRDMQEERDVLIKNIFPKLRNLAEQRLVTLTPIDLRWGITEDESKTGKVIELCLQEIERCQPFFIGILGNHYGWCPSISDMKENTMLLDQYQWLQKDLEEGLSITEIEMQFAVLRKQHHANAFFFIRRSVTDQEQRDSKLNKLINKIQSKGQDFLTAELTPDTDSQCYYAYYDTPEELGRLVEDALVSLLDALFPLGSDEDEWIRESRAQQAFLQNLNDIYVPMANNEFITYFMNQMTERYKFS